MLAILIAAITIYSLGLATLCLITRRRFSPQAIRFSLLYLMVVGLIAAINFEAGIVPQKSASELAFRIYQGGLADQAPTFLVQALLNIFPFFLTGSWYAAIGTNVALMAVLAAYTYDRTRSIALIVCAPAVVNFAIFALRDPIIGACFFFLTLRLCLPSPRLRSKITEWTVAVLTYLARPETIAIYLGGKAAMLRSAVNRRTWILVFLPLAILAVVLGITYLPRTLGLESQAALNELPETFDSFFTQRADRATSLEGAGSNILGGTLSSYPLPLRFAIQVVTFFILPLPFEIANAVMALAFLDSIVFILVVRHFLRAAPSPAKRLFWLYVIAVSFFAVNYGNLFRLRMPAYFILAGGLVASRLLLRRDDVELSDSDHLPPDRLLDANDQDGDKEDGDKEDEGDGAVAGQPEPPAPGPFEAVVPVAPPKPDLGPFPTLGRPPSGSPPR